MYSIKNTLALLFVLMVLSACSGGGGGGGGGSTSSGPSLNALPGLASCTPVDPSQTLLCGTAVASDGVTPLAGAEVSTVSSTTGGVVIGAVADPTRCLTDDQGEFACVVPTGMNGDIDFMISSQGFEDVAFTANIVEGGITTSDPLVMTADNSTVWVVVPGAFDGVQVLLAQLKNCTLGSEAGGDYDPALDLPHNARGSQDCVDKGLIVLDGEENSTSPYYAPDYLASGALANADALFINCSANYSFLNDVNTSISQFVANGGHTYISDLSSFWLETLFPGNVTFLGNDTNIGTMTGVSVHQGLAAVVGNMFDIVFDEPVWTAIDTVEPGVTTFVEGDLSEVGNYMNTHPVTVGWRETETSGCVYYTSFHIEGNSTGAPQELAMKYMVQNIGTVCT